MAAFSRNQRIHALTLRAKVSGKPKGIRFAGSRKLSLPEFSFLF